MNVEELKRTVKGLKRWKPIRGIYFLVSAGEVVYVGKTTDLAGSLTRPDRQHDEAHYVETEAKRLDSERRRFVRAMKPPLNKPVTGRPPMEGVRRKAAGLLADGRDWSCRKLAAALGCSKTMAAGLLAAKRRS